MKQSTSVAGKAIAAALFLSGCSSVFAQPELIELASEQICFADHAQPITAEIADTFDSRARGLMFRESLREHHGMLFRYRDERPSNAGFWMYNTYIPLDIAYLDKQQRIVSIVTMEPCPSIDPKRCPAYPPGTTYYSALEMNQGYFAKYGIGVGSKLTTCPEEQQ